MSKKLEVQKIYPLTPMQEGMLFHYLMDQEKDAYVLQTVLSVEGKLDVDLFEKCFNIEIDRHELLRSIFTYEKVQRPKQVVLKQRRFAIGRMDISGLPEDEKQARIGECIESEKKKGFNLAKDALMRVVVIACGPGSYRVVWTYHHIIMDGWCFGLIVSEILKIYQALKNDQAPQLGLIYPFGNYLDWLGKQDKEAAVRYWREYLDDYENQAHLPFFGKRPDRADYQAREHCFSLDSSLTGGLNRTAAQCQVTVNAIVQAVWGTLLQRYNNTDDVVFGTVVSGRPAGVDGIESMVGLFINTIPVRFAGGDQTFLEAASALQRDALASEKYGFVPLAEIQAQSELKQNLFDHILVFENYPLEQGIKDLSLNQGLGFRITGVAVSEQTHYDLTVIVTPGSELNVKLSYNALVYDREFMEKIEGHFIAAAKAVVARQDVPCSKIRILTGPEEGRLLKDLTNTAAEYPKGKTIHQLFEEQAAKTPHHLAIVFEDRHKTYHLLNERANQLARALRERGVGRDVIVAIMADRSIEMVIGILAIIKAGGAFLPIDPGYPADRIKYMLDDSQARLLLCRNHLSPHTGFAGEIIDLENKALFAGDASNLDSVNTPDDLLYIIYTSGTTGKPKAVMLEHKNLVNLVCFEYARTGIDFSANVLNFITVSFDVCYQEIFSTLLAGGKLCIIGDDDKKDVNKLLAFIRENEINVIFFPTSFLIFMSSEQEYLDKLPKTVKHIITAGEQLIIRDELKRYLKENNVCLHNHYGPSETHVVTAYTVQPQDDIPELPPIGKPVSNTQLYIMNRGLMLQPVGVPGELFIAGDNVGRGYLGRDELTKEKFLDDPRDPRGRMYRTGDLVRWLPDGNVEYMGRLDHQVKIRGFRVELGEIENELISHPAVKDAVVAALKDAAGSKYLCAYIVAEGAVSPDDLRSYLAKEVPDFMIPAYFMFIEQMPLKPNGKIDWHRLPECAAGSRSGDGCVPPQNVTEQRLAEMWREILGQETIGVTDNFFEMGGHSLKAISLAAKVNKEFNVEIPLRKIFKSPTIRELAGFILRAEENIFAAIEPADARDYYPLSAAQKRIFILDQFEPGGISYNMPALLRIDGPIDRGRLEGAFGQLIRRHESLRTSFEIIDGVPEQRIHAAVPFALQYPETTTEGLDRLSRAFVRPFDLSAPPLLRAALVQLAPGSHILLYDMHHIVSDGVSLRLLTRELIALYQGAGLPPLRIQYKDYSCWQKELLKSEEIKQQEAYWLNRFGGELPVLNLPADRPRPPLQSFEGDQIDFEFDPELSAAVRKMAAERGATLYMSLLALWAILLSKYSGQQDIVIGTPVAGRRHADLDGIIGMFVNTVAVRNNVDVGATFTRLLDEVKESLLKDYENQDYQFEELVEKLGVSRDLSRNPLFDVMFSIESGDDDSIEAAGLRITPQHYHSTIAKFDLSLGAVDGPNAIGFGLEYSTKLYNSETIQRMIGHFINIARQAAADPGRKIADIELMTAGERRLISDDFNSTVTEYPQDQTVIKLFEEQVARTPGKTAVIFQDKQLTYAELNAKANCLARALRDRGVKPDGIVGLMVEPSLELAVGIWGVLKAGGAYLPMDPDNPKQRQDLIFREIDTGIMLGQQRLLEKAEFAGVKIDIAQASAGGDDSNPEPVNVPGDLAYVIYTSGSTGVPKGVMAEHQNINVYVHAFLREFKLTPDDVMPHLAPYTFDSFVEEFYPTFLSGATLVIPTRSEIKDANQLVRVLSECNITIISASPLLLNELNRLPPVPGIKTYISGADVLKEEYITNIKRYGTVYNTYGPTEATVCATYFRCGDEARTSIPIGRPIANYRVHIMDKNMKPLPAGVPGEICISGKAVARGYLRQPEMTAVKFMDDPVVPGQRMYRTGDLGRWLADGNIEFMGRIDTQVKIRGFRIELGEIEAQLLTHEAISQAVVIDREDQDKAKYLCAYIVSGREWTVLELREYLSQKLPEYMIPSFFMQVESIPLTSRGKIDKKALPHPDRTMKTGIEYRAPRNDVEEKIAEIWEDIFEVERIGIDDNFFALGGHSLKAIQVINLIHKELNASLGIHQLFQNPTIAGISEIIRDSGANAFAVIERLPERDHYELSYPQRRLWVIHQLEPQSIAYNMPGLITLNERVDSTAIEQALQQLVERHESLRTRFAAVAGNPVQIVDAAAAVKLQIHDLSALEEGERQRRRGEIFDQESQRPFDLEKGPLLRVALIKVNDSTYDLIYVMHHIITDGWSLEILKREFHELYEASKINQACQLEQLPVQYRDFAAWQNRLLADSGRMEAAKEYWSRQLSGEIPVLDLPRDHAFASITDRKSAGYRVVIDDGETIRRLNGIAGRHQSSLFMVLLTALQLYLSRTTGQQEIVLGMSAAGREHENVKNVIGFFINTVILRGRMDHSLTFGELLAATKTSTIDALQYQSYPLELVVDELKIKYPELTVFVNMLNMEQGANERLEDTRSYQIEQVQDTKFDMVLYLAEYTNGIEIVCHYLAGMFEAKTIGHIIEEYVKLLKRIAEDPGKTARDYFGVKTKRKITR